MDKQPNIQIVQLDPEELKQSIIASLKEMVAELEALREPKTLTEYLTRQQLADWLQIDLSTIHNWKKKGKITAYSIGNRVYFKREEIEASMTPLKG